MRFLAELRRRNVFRAGTLYAAVAWLIVQVATQVFPFFAIADWVVRLIVIAAAIGFPVVLAVAWYYEITPEGLKLESEVPREASIRHRTGKRIDHAIIAVLCVIVVLLLANTLVRRHDAGAIPDKSVAVLPLLNENGDAGDQYFSDGLSEDLISMLSQVPELKVIGRNSAFRFRGDLSDSRGIGAKLGVANLLEGTVRRQGERVRIVASLISAADSRVIWSQTYDRELKDIFEVQSDIAHSVASSMRATLLGKTLESTDEPPGGDLAAYNAYLQGNFYRARSTEADDRTAIAHYQEAVRIDPRYASAYAAMSYTWTMLAGAFLEGPAMQQAYVRARAAADTALSLDPDLAFAHIARGVLLSWADFDWKGAEAEFRRALQLAPNDGDAMGLLAGLMATLGHPDQAVEMKRRALDKDPLHATWYEALATYYSAIERLDDAQHAIDKAIALQPNGASFHQTLAVIAIQRGDAQAALHAAEAGPPGSWQDLAIALARQIGGDPAAADAVLRDVIAKYGDGNAYQIAQIYALRKQPEPMFAWLERAWANRDPGVSYLLYDPFVLVFRNDPRFTAFCRKIGLPPPPPPKPGSTAGA
ncbi:MAG: Adenylate cyclase [Rhodanobacteraceae bacterium]|jgi:TolB-like protein/Tfp pilus assembly protein PilF|nr:MAG: Adenylate cyclase [Rhodanobacteraceae bacterium]